MKKQVKYMLIEICESILSIHIEIINISNSNNSKSDDQIISLFSMCQEAAIAIGGILEKDSDDYTPQITILEKYCENLFNLAQNPIFDKNKFQLLTSDIKEFNDFLNNIPHILEVVFFPYHSSMWDCMESVYFSFLKKPNCNCTVMPIPYSEYNKEADEWEERYDGENLPLNIPIVHYDSFNIEDVKPDIAFIHNPYDEFNQVTRVNETYFSRNIKKYTKVLVYIPYFATAEVFENKNLETAAYASVDIIVVQTEAIKEMFKQFSYYNKVVALGSPKFDKVINTCNEGGKMPSAWKLALEGKKILMLNTTIAPFVNFGIYVIDKLMYVFNCVKNSDEIAIIWRPHPLLEATIKSMMTDLQEKYYEVVEFFLNNNVGVIDKTADITNTIALSDGYIGDAAGSVVNLFSITGKPLFILEYKITEELTEDEKRKFLIYNIIAYKNEFIAFPNECGGLFKISSDFRSIQYIDSFDKENDWVPSFGKGSIELDDKIYLPPRYGSYFCIYDIENKKFEILKEKEDWVEQWIFCINYKDNIVYIPFKGHSIQMYNTKTKQWNTYDAGLELLEQQKNDIVFAQVSEYEIIENQLFMCMLYNNNIVVFDLDKKTYKYIPLGNIENGYGGIKYSDGFLWLGEKTGEIVRYNLKTEESIFIKSPKGFKFWKNMNNITMSYFNIIDYDNYIILAAWFSNSFVKVNKNNLRAELLFENILKSECESQLYNNKIQYATAYFLYKLNRKEIIMYMPISRCLIKVDIETEKYEKFELKLSQEDYDKVKKAINKDMYGFKKSSNYHMFSKIENKYNHFNGFCKELVSGELDELRVIQKKYIQYISNNLDGTSGEKISEYILKNKFDINYLNIKIK